MANIEYWARIGRQSRVPGSQYFYVCETTADRDAITGVVEGESCYCRDTKEEYTYNGSLWAPMAGGGLDQAQVFARGLGA